MKQSDKETLTPSVPKIEDLAKLIEQLPEEKKGELREYLRIERSVTTFSGPIPSPEVFSQYPEWAQKDIMLLAKDEQHIRSDESVGIQKIDRMKIRGSVFLGLGVLGLAAYALYLGGDITAVFLVFMSPLSSLIALAKHWLTASQP